MEPKKLGLLRVLEILQKYSDPDHHLKQEDIIDYLEQDYALSLERKAVSRNLSLLKEAGYPIESNKTGSWLTERTYSASELRILIDSVLSSRFLSADQKKELINKLCREASVFFRSNVRHIHSAGTWNTRENPQILQNIDLICDAIDRKRKIRYTLLRIEKDKKLHPAKEITSTPCGIFISGQQYHMLEIRGEGNWDSKDIPKTLPPYAYALPLWKIADIRILEENQAIDQEKVAEFGKDPDIPRIIAEHAMDENGFPINSRFVPVSRYTIACSSRCIGAALETFGPDIQILSLPDPGHEDFDIRQILQEYGLLHDSHDYHLHAVSFYEEMVRISVKATEDAIFRFVSEHAPDTVILTPAEAAEKYEQRLVSLLTYHRKLVDFYDAAVTETETWKQRPIAPVFPIVTTGSAVLKVRSRGMVRSLTAGCLLGTKPDGSRELLDIVLSDKEDPGAWKMILRDLKDRGLQSINYLNIYDLEPSGLRAAAQELFPSAKITHIPRLTPEDRIADPRRHFAESEYGFPVSGITKAVRIMERVGRSEINLCNQEGIFPSEKQLLTELREELEKTVAEFEPIGGWNRKWKQILQEKESDQQ